MELGDIGDEDVQPPFTLVFRNPGAVRTMVVGGDPLRIAEAYLTHRNYAHHVRSLRWVKP